MNVVGIIDQYNLERPNSVEDSTKKDFLRKCEANIIENVILLYDDDSETDWAEHLADFDFDTELVVDEPFDDLYIYYLDQRIAMNNNDTKRYNVAARMYDNALLAFRQKYNKDHRPKQPRKMLLQHEVL